MTRKRKYLLINALVVLIILILIEGISCGILQVIYNREFDSSLLVDNKYFTSAGLKENASGIVWGKPFHTDQFGGRKNAKANSGKKKRLFIGDSVTEGVGVEDSATFSSLHSKELTDFNLLNISLIGYSSYDYLNVLRCFLAKDSAIESIMLFYCLNDVYGEAKTKDLPIMAKQSYIGKANSFLQDRIATYKLLKLLFYQNSSSYFKYDSQFYTSDNPHYIESMRHLKQCDSICKSQNILFRVVLLPYRSQLKNLNENGLPQQLLEAFCKKQSIEVSDASSFLAKKDDIKALYLFADEIHFSEKGHRAIAAFLSR
jgi:lysophospholipase L1-like esterase